MQQGLLSGYNPSDALMPPAQQGYRGLLSRLEQRDKGGAGISPYQVSAFGSAFLPSAGISDVLGFAPDPNKVGGTLPSFTQNMDQGNYIDAGLQTLGASGDVMLASAPFAPFLLAPAVGAKLISQFGKGVRGASKVAPETGLLGDVNKSSNVFGSVESFPKLSKAEENLVSSSFAPTNEIAGFGRVKVENINNRDLVGSKQRFDELKKLTADYKHDRAKARIIRLENGNSAIQYMQPPTEIKNLNISDLIATQDNVVLGTNKTSGSPLVVKKNGKFYIRDGHHRIAQKVNAGEKTTDVRVIDLDQGGYYGMDKSEIKTPIKNGLLGKNNEIKDPLIVQHNINETALLESDRLGGLPVPSLAVSKVDNPLLGFGDVTLVGNPNMAKPSGSNPVYRADAYTTRRPKPEIEVNQKAEDFAENNVTNVFKDIPKGSNVAELDGYNVNQSIAEDLYKGFEGSSSNIPLRAKYMIDKGLLDPKQFETQYDITKFVRSNFTETEDYTNYITKLKKDMIASGGNAKEKLFVTYTNNGRKYLPATLENYVKMMKKKRGAGEETTFPSMGALRAKLTPKFKNITEVKSERNRVVSREKFEEVKNQVNLDYEDLLSDLSKKLPEKTDWRTSEELFEDLILNKLGTHPYSKPYEPYIDDAIKKSASELREKLKSIPTEYFEVKPQRGVGIEEFEGAIIPDNSLKSTEEILKRRGINKIFKYGSDEERKELMKRFPELMFSVGGLGLLGIGSGEEEPVSLL